MLASNSEQGSALVLGAYNLALAREKGLDVCTGILVPAAGIEIVIDICYFAIGGIAKIGFIVCEIGHVDDYEWFVVVKLGVCEIAQISPSPPD